MKSLVSQKLGPPSTYEVVESPDPVITKPTQIIVRIKATSINPIDVKKASGATKAIEKVPQPYPIGLDFSGIVEAVGSAVTAFRSGDEVYGVKSQPGGTAGTHILLDPADGDKNGSVVRDALVLKPSEASFAEAASLAIVGVTAVQALQQADAHLAGGLAGKTVFVPAALSGTGSVALQIAKRVYGCTVYTAVSPGKVARVPELLGVDVVDKIADYTKAEPLEKQLGAERAVDFVFDTTGNALSYLPLIKNGGFMISIARIPSWNGLRDVAPTAPAPVFWLVGLQHSLVSTWLKLWWGVGYDWLAADPTSGEELENLSKWIKEGKIKTMIGRTAKLDDLKAVQEGCEEVLSGKGGIGKFVIEI